MRVTNADGRARAAAFITGCVRTAAERVPVPTSPAPEPRKRMDHALIPPGIAEPRDALRRALEPSKRARKRGDLRARRTATDA